VYAVTGGTGAYRTARGEIIVRPGEDRFQITLQLR